MNIGIDYFNLPEGPCALQFPLELSEASYDEFKCWLELEIKTRGRSITKKEIAQVIEAQEMGK